MVSRGSARSQGDHRVVMAVAFRWPWLQLPECWRRPVRPLNEVASLHETVLNGVVWELAEHQVQYTTIPRCYLEPLSFPICPGALPAIGLPSGGRIVMCRRYFMRVAFVQKWGDLTKGWKRNNKHCKPMN